ncbi:MAG: MFS transporter [Cyanobacteria bacterium P01_D01_bin.115]
MSVTSDQSDATPATQNAFAPLRSSAFQRIWLASLVANLSLWMYSIAAAWLMTSLSSSPLMVSLMQTASSLPAFLIGLPAGALADIFDRRRLLVATQFWLIIIVGCLAALTLLDGVTPGLLLVFTFLLGLGTAATGPVWQAVIPEIVPAAELKAALTLQGSSIDLARAIGPIVAGVIAAAMGPWAVFALNAIVGVGLVLLLQTVPRPPEKAELMPEQMIGAMRAGIRYALHAGQLQVVLLRTGLCMAAASALWALLPVLVRYDLQLGSEAFGILYGVMGVGSMVGVFVLPSIYQKLSTDGVVLTATGLYGLVLLGLSVGGSFWMVCGLMAIAGVAWIGLMSSFSIVATAAGSAWVRARALSLFQLVMQGSMALGSLLWGTIASAIGTSQTLAIAALGMALNIIAALWLRFGSVEQLDLNPAHSPFEPELAVVPAPGDGPVLVMLEYDVNPQQVADFVASIHTLRHSRERDGALRWDLWQDTAIAHRFIECFIVETWAEHYRQYQRFTVSDKQLEDRALSFVQAQSAHAKFFVFARPQRILPSRVPVEP